MPGHVIRLRTQSGLNFNASLVVDSPPITVVRRNCVPKYTPERALADNMMIFLYEYECMPKVSVEVPQELLDDLDEHVGDEGKFVNRSDAIRASIRKTLDMLDEIDERHGRIETDESESH